MTEMSTSEAGFYTAVATAIPVLLVAYAVSLNRFASDKAGPAYDRSMKSFVLGFVNFATRRTAVVRRVAGGLLSGTGSIALLLGVSMAVVLPGVGEYESLHALASGSASSLTEVLTWVGVLVALGVAAAPLLFKIVRSFSFVPFVKYLVAAKRNAQSIEELYSHWEHSEGRLDPRIALDYVDGAGTSSWKGSDNFPEFCSKAWGESFPEWRGTEFVDDKRLLVYDRIGEAKRATFFEVADGKVSHLITYSNRDQAIAENEERRKASRKKAIPSGPDPTQQSLASP